LSGLTQRILTSIVLLPGLLSLMVWGPWQSVAVVGFVVAIVGLWEFTGIVLPDGSNTIRFISVGWCILLMLGLVTFWSPPVARPAPFDLSLVPPATPLFVALLMGLALTFLIFEGKREDLSPVPSRVGLVFLGIVYLGGLAAHLIFLCRLPDAMDFKEHFSGWLFLALACTFLADTGGYFFGKFIGGPKLFPSVSPNKTWAGLFGCIVGASLGAWGVRFTLMPFLQPVDCLIIGCGAAVLGQTGDFFESLLKRAYGVKDSGTILPGHGGILDRVDGLLFNAPLIFYYAIWVVLARPA